MGIPLSSEAHALYAGFRPGATTRLAFVITRYYISAMKRRDPDPAPPATALEDLCLALLSLRSTAEARAFLDDLCTPAELEAIADRWRVVPQLVDDVPYREIHDRTGVSVTTIGRVARCLERGAGGYRLVADRLGHVAPDDKH
jgi:TrpR-related protein YerC/YecD